MALMHQAVELGKPFDVTLIDRVMPGIDGETLCRQIKSDAVLAGTQLIMVTSVGHRGDAARAKELGCAAYLTKPVKSSHLYDCLMTVLARRAGGENQRADHPLITRHLLSESKRHSAKILLAEDNVVNRKLGLKILDNLGFTADTVANGREAIEAAERKRYDLIFMDVQMPEVDGLEATARIRSGEKDSHVPIIALTAHAMKGDREKCLKAGMDDYVSKPIDPQQLADTIEKYLDAS